MLSTAAVSRQIDFWCGKRGKLLGTFGGKLSQVPSSFHEGRETAKVNRDK